MKNLGWNGCGTTQYHYLFQLHFRPDKNSIHHKSGCHRDNQNYTFLFGRVWLSALPLNYAAWINLSWKTSGKVVWWYLISTDATQWEHQKEARDECGEGCVTVGGWLARLSPRLVNAVNNMLHQWRKSLPPYAMFLLNIGHLRNSLFYDHIFYSFILFPQGSRMDRIRSFQHN